VKIQRVHARELLDSRGYPTLEADVVLSDGTSGSAIVPSGLSTGRREAREIRDFSQARWAGKGVLGPVSKVNGEISKALVGTEAGVRQVDQLLIELDGTPDKSSLGANALLAVSLANARAITASRKIPLYELLQELSETPSLSIPTPMVNIMSGGLHADGSLTMQDFLVVPLGASSFRLALDWVGSVYHATKRLLKEMGLTTLLADEGGFGPRLGDNEEALNLLQKSIAMTGLEPGKDVALAVDVASSHFFREGLYHVGEGRALHRHDMVSLLERWISDYPIISLEDGCAEDDWEGWKELTSRVGSRVQLVGDDLFTTNPVLIEAGKAKGVANAVLVKPNQIGTLSETLESIQVCKKIEYAPVISARSGDTEDPFIADLAVGTSAGQIKIGSLARSERTAKYNQLLRLDELLGKSAPYSGRHPFPFASN